MTRSRLLLEPPLGKFNVRRRAGLCQTWDTQGARPHISGRAPRRSTRVATSTGVAVHQSTSIILASLLERISPPWSAEAGVVRNHPHGALPSSPGYPYGGRPAATVRRNRTCFPDSRCPLPGWLPTTWSLRLYHGRISCQRHDILGNPRNAGAFGFTDRGGRQAAGLAYQMT